jgi:hypothetical protein
VTQALIALTLGDEVGRAFFLSGSIATVIVGLLLFYIEISLPASLSNSLTGVP